LPVIADDGTVRDPRSSPGLRDAPPPAYYFEVWDLAYLESRFDDEFEITSELAGTIVAVK